MPVNRRNALRGGALAAASTVLLTRPAFAAPRVLPAAPVSPVPTGAAHRGWRSAVILVVILAFVVIEAAGLCSTYGRIVLG